MVTLKRTTLSSRLGALVGKGAAPTRPNRVIRVRAKPRAEDGGGGIKDGEVVKLGKDDQPLSSILRSTKGHGRAPRPTQYLHVSDVLSKCLRRVALMEKYSVSPTPQNLTLNDLLTYAQGDAIHNVMKDKVAKSPLGNAWGQWACLCGKTVTEQPSLLSEVPQGAKCQKCNGELDRYTEISLVDETLRIVGHPDLIVLLEGLNALHVTELKSIAADAWKELVRPKPDHVLQALFYWYLLRNTGYRVTNRVSVVYVTKGWLFGNTEPYKEFTFDAEAEIHRLEDFFRDARELIAARSGGDLPVRTCASPQSPDAKKCDMCQTCFGVPDDSKPVSISISAALGKGERNPRSRG